MINSEANIRYQTILNLHILIRDLQESIKFTESQITSFDADHYNHHVSITHSTTKILNYLNTIESLNCPFFSNKQKNDINNLSSLQFGFSTHIQYLHDTHTKFALTYNKKDLI